MEYAPRMLSLVKTLSGQSQGGNSRDANTLSNVVNAASHTGVLMFARTAHCIYGFFLHNCLL